MVKVVSAIILFCIIIEVAKCEQKQQPFNTQNLYQHITTEIIDLPDDSAAYNNLLGQYRSSHSGDVMYPWPVHQNGAVGNNNFRIQGNGNGQGTGSANMYPPYANGYSNQQPLPYNYGYMYRPFYPSDYVSRYYPTLYQDFPNGFYILPDTQNLADTTNVVTVKDEDKQRNVVDTGNVGINLNDIKIDTTDKPQAPNLRITNYTRVNEKKTFVNHVELKPVSTKMTRYGGSDGKMYVKVTSSDPDGQEKITESEYNGNVDLKITNGVLETPNNSSGKSTKNQKVDPNSITADINTRTSNQEDEEEENQEEEVKENGKPIDITSWLG